MFIPYPGSDFLSSRIPDTTFFHPGSRIHIKEFKVFNPKKIVFQALGNMIRILIFYPSRIQGSKKHRIPDPYPQHCFSPRLSPPLGIVLGADKSVADDAEVHEEEDGGDGEGEGEDELPRGGRHKGVQLDTVLSHALRPVLVR
jgi:hypothetical protein